MALLHAQTLGFSDLQHQLTSMLVDVDERRERQDAAAAIDVGAPA